MIHLGISQDRYDAGIAVTDGQRVLYAANEERFTRKKSQGGFPSAALDAAFGATGIGPTDIGRICVAGIMTPPLAARAFPWLQRWLFSQDFPAASSLSNRVTDFLAFRTPLAHTTASTPLRQVTQKLLPLVMRRTLQPPLRDLPLSFVEHHRAHAAVGCCLSGFSRALCITADGMGDGLSISVSRWSNGSLERLWTAASRHSLGLFYEMMTEALGFIPNRHEGKVTGLAAHGDASRIPLSSPFEMQDGQLTYRGPHGRRGVAWARHTLVARHAREDIAAWMQRIVERNVVAIARTWLRGTALDTLVLSGGLFANVKLNHALRRLEEVRRLFVCPNMGDGGQSLGAICAEGGLQLQPVTDVFWGESHTERDIAAVLGQSGLRYEAERDIEDSVAALVAQGHIVARFRGEMEWGPRALGNRSILARTTDPRVVEQLNRRLERSDFMPFAPAVLDEDADAYFEGLEGARHAARFMTICFDATARMRVEHPAVVHVDGTARPQLVQRDSNPTFHRLLTAYKRRTGAAMVLNTSFNIHEEPIVRTPADAVATFVRGRLDYLALGPYLVCAPHVQSIQSGDCRTSFASDDRRSVAQ